MTRIKTWLATAGMFILLVFSSFILGRKKGKEVERERIKHDDLKKADEIRSSIERDLDKRLRKFEGVGFRD